eukprot:gene4328-11741_t
MSFTDVRTIDVVWFAGKWYSMDNRRLWCFKHALAGGTVVAVNAFSRGGYHGFDKKFSTSTGGTTIHLN